MPITVNVAGVPKAVTQVWVNVAGVWKQAVLWVNVAGTWVSLAEENVDVAISPSLVEGTRVGSGSTQTDQDAIATPTPAGSYAYRWVRAAGSTQISASSPNSARTRFVAFLNTGQQLTATFRCEVLDGGQVVGSDTVQVRLTSEDPVGGGV